MEWETITSRTNDKIKVMKQLKNKKFRNETNQCLIEGRKVVEEAFKSNVQIQTVLVREKANQEELALATEIQTNDTNVTVFWVTPEVMEAVCDVNTPQGIVAIAQIPVCRDFILGEGNYIVLDGLQDPGNVGTLIRSADAFQYAGILLDERSADPYSPKCIRSSTGSVFHMKMYQVADLCATLSQAQQDGLYVIGTDLKGKEEWPETNSAPIALCIGSEGRGLSDELLALSDWRFRLPIPGQAESLNASVFSGIMMYALWQKSL